MRDTGKLTDRPEAPKGDGSSVNPWLRHLVVIGGMKQREPSRCELEMVIDGNNPTIRCGVDEFVGNLIKVGTILPRAVQERFETNDFTGPEIRVPHTL